MLRRSLHSHTIIDSSQETMLFIFFGWLFVALIFTVLAYAYPIRSREDPTVYRTTLTVTLAACFFPAYLIWLAYDNPVRDQAGNPSVFLTVVTFPIYFCVAPPDYWDTYQPKRI